MFDEPMLLQPPARHAVAGRAGDEPVDLVGTVRKGTWAEWVEEFLGDLEDPWTRSTGGCVWWSRHSLARRAERGSRFYVVSEGRLRLCVTLGHPRPRRPGEWTPLQVDPLPEGAAGFEPVTLEAGIRGFRGLRRRWWPREIERPCPDWKGAGLGLEEGEL